MMERYYIREITPQDIRSIVNIYNSNSMFLSNHLGLLQIDEKFVINDKNEIGASGFLSCVIVDKETKRVIGVIDYKPENEVYLSLLMIHASFQGNGIGKHIYNMFEESMLRLGKHLIRIDVVNDYVGNVVPFWEKLGFDERRVIRLKWGNKESNALIMKKIF